MEVGNGTEEELEKHGHGPTPPLVDTVVPKDGIVGNLGLATKNPIKTIDRGDHGVDP